MTPDDFTSVLARDLRVRGIPFNHADLEAFVAAAWPWIDDEPDVGRWADEFLGSQLRGLVDGIGVMPAGMAASEAGE